MLINPFPKYPTSLTDIVHVPFSARYQIYDIRDFTGNLLW